MNNTKTIRSVIVATLAVFIFCVPAPGQNQPATGLLRAHFTTEQGLSGSVVDHIAQTPDGFLWLVTNGINLVRFDGKNFYRFDLRVTTLTASPGGDMWAGTRDDLKHIPSSNFNQFTLAGLTSYHPGPGKESGIIRLLVSRSGVLWVGTNGGLFRYDGNQFVAVGPRVAIRELEEAPDGHILIITPLGFIELDGSREVPHPGLPERLGVKHNEIFHVLRDRQGNTWYSTAKGVARETRGQIERLGTYGSNGHAAYRAYEDKQGTVWIGKDEGLFRATSSGLELVAAGMKVRSLYGDRDGNLWVGTNGDGLYRFRQSAIQMFTTDDGLPNNIIMTVLTAHDGTVWTGANCGGLSRFDGTRFQTFNEKHGLLNTCVWAIAEDANHDLWIGTWGGGAFRYRNGTFTQYSMKEGLVDDRVTSIVTTRDGSVWLGTRSGMTRIKDGQIRNFRTWDGLSSRSIIRAFADRAGVIWAAGLQGLDRLVGDRFEPFAAFPKTFAYALGQDRDGGIFVRGDVTGEVLRLDKDRIETVTGVPAASDMIETAHGEVWFGGTTISRVRTGDLRKPRQHDEPLEYESFSTADGLAMAEVSSSTPSLALTHGKLWAATPKGVAVFDLDRLPITDAKPSIYLTDLTIGRNKQNPDREIVLPPGTNHVKIDFAAVEISSPEKIRLQYRLDDVDSEWLDAGADAQAIYTRVPVGTHALRIRACNRNGIWDRQGVAFNITQQPYFYQTRWFIAAMVALGSLLVFLLYNLRVAQISRMLSARFDERLAERTRVARELHDTLLQTVQGSKMVVDHALKNSADHSRMVRAMEQLATWLAQATEEGRAALHSLRASSTEKNNLAEAFRRAIDECGIANKAEISLSVNGNSTEMHPVVRDEIYRIGYEAIRNACAHSGGNRLDIMLEYAHDLTLRISDNGIGIDSAVIDGGREGHFGLRGMRERAERISSKFSLSSSRDSGTIVTLVVPGRVAFHTGN